MSNLLDDLSSRFPHPITVHKVPGLSSLFAGGKQTGTKCSWNATLVLSWNKKKLKLISDQKIIPYKKMVYLK